MGDNSTFSSSATSSLSPSPTPTAVTTGNGTTNGTLSHTTHKGLSNGAAAGVGIGCAIGGAILALIAIALFTRCRNRRPNNNNISNLAYQPTPNAKSSSSDYESKSTSITPLVDIPIERADDSQIKKSLTDLHELVNQHVENHYPNQPFTGQPADLERELVKCGFSQAAGSGAESAGYMASILIDPRTRGPGIRKLIAHVILAHSQPDAPKLLSLLPASIAGISRAMLQVRRRPGEEQAFETAFAKWRQLSAFLLDSPERRDGTLTDDDVKSAVLENVLLLNEVLEPFIGQGQHAQRQQADNLSSIVQEGADTALLLFSQPSKTVFGWAGAGTSGLVVFPSVAEEVRNGARSLKVIVPATVEQI